MKINVYVSCNLMLCGIFSLCLNNQLFGHEKVNLSLGIGYPELLNAGVRFQLEQAQIGAGVGFFPLTDESLITISGDFFIISEDTLNCQTGAPGMEERG